MALFIRDFYSHQAIDFDSFVRCINGVYSDTSCLEPPTINLMAEMLYRLAKNKEFLTHKIANQIAEAGSLPSQHWLSDNDTLVLYQNSRPYFQLVASFMPPQLEESTDQRALVKDYLHDHNFSFLTTNYYGPGTASELYTYRYSNQLKVGEPCHLSFEKFHQLTDDEVLFFEASKDIHRQALPKSFSISLELRFEQNGNRHFSFDHEKLVIKEEIKSGKQVASDFLAELLYET
ncbi:transposase [Pseudoalteromonas sp. T1lg65]|uniref:transposase n=1 Tax=Pseudoalteromonas sp. T1lg65 TaxID=2077101 RepID=UPI003F78DF4B